MQNDIVVDPSSREFVQMDHGIVQCKCCSATTEYFASLDFSRSCEDSSVVQPFDPSGEMIPYRICPRCGFIFTRYFDDWSSQQMADRIYNEDYHLADPGFAEARPAGFAAALSKLLGNLRSSIAALDFGGGKGTLAALMQERGFDYDCFDPYFSDSPGPNRRFDLVTSFEVVEHSPDPIGSFVTMLSHAKPNGAILFSTNLQPRCVTSDWWYIAPRNGHISIHTARSLQFLAAQLGVRFLTLGNHVHLLYRHATDSVPRVLLRNDVFGFLWQASRQNLRALAFASRAAVQVGRPLMALDPRHAARLLLGEAGFRHRRAE